MRVGGAGVRDTTNDSSPSRESRILEWLEKNGYPLEMRVAQAMLAEGFSVAQGTIYSDPDTGKNREMDIIASRSRYFENSFIGVRFVIECKRAHESPWLLFTIPGSDLGTGWPSKQILDEFDYVNKRILYATEWAGSCSLLQPARQLGYALTESLRKDKNTPDRAYEAAQTVSKCAYKTLRLDVHLFETEGDFATNLVMPVILIDGDLYECSLNEKSEPQLRQTDRGVLTSKRPTDSGWDMLIRIETFKDCKAFAAAAKDFAERILQDDVRLRSVIASEKTIRLRSRTGGVVRL